LSTFPVAPPTLDALSLDQNLQSPDIFDLVLEECSCELKVTSPRKLQFSAILHCGEELLDHMKG